MKQNAIEFISYIAASTHNNKMSTTQKWASVKKGN
jgi:hypothetical protein